jgi:hypothetical protein
MLTRFLNLVISLALMRAQNCLPEESMTAHTAVRQRTSNVGQGGNGVVVYVGL